jgi:hypothetical protein
MKKAKFLLALPALIWGQLTFAQANEGNAQEEAARKQQEAAAQQEAGMKSQKEQVAKQQAMAKLQEEKAAEQEAVMKEIKNELLKDGLIEKDAHFEFRLNSRELIINGKKQSDEMHKKYLRIINSKRKQPFGKDEEWNIKQ